MAPSVLLPIWKKKKKIFPPQVPKLLGCRTFPLQGSFAMAERCFRRGKTELPKLCKQRRKKRDKRSREKKKKRAQTVAETPRAKRRSNRLKKTENEPGEGGASGGLELGKGFRFFFFPVGAQRPITTGVRNISFRPASIVWRTKKKKIVYGESLLTGKKKKLRFPAPLGSPAARPALAGWPGAAGRFFFFFFFSRPSGGDSGRLRKSKVVHRSDFSPAGYRPIAWLRQSPASASAWLGKNFRAPPGAAIYRTETTGVRNISFRPASIVWRTKKKKKYRVWGVAVEGRKKKKFLSHRPSCVPQLPDRAATARALVAFHFSTSVRPVRLSRFRPAPHWSWPHRGRGLCDFRALVTIGVRNISTGVRLLKGKCPAPQ